jgi:hypothetical protein
MTPKTRFITPMQTLFDTHTIGPLVGGGFVNYGLVTYNPASLEDAFLHRDSRRRLHNYGLRLAWEEVRT